MNCAIKSSKLSRSSELERPKARRVLPCASNGPQTFHCNVGEAPLLGDDDLLATGELVTSTAESLHDDGGVLLLATDGEDDLANVDTGDSAIGLTPSTTHTGLESICTSTGQHLVDSDNVEGVSPDTKME